MNYFTHTRLVLPTLKKLFLLSNLLCGGLTTLNAQTTFTFNYSGSIQSYTIPSGVTSVSIVAKGAQGGGASPRTGGLGAQMSGIFTVTPGQVLNILVGQYPGSTNNGGGGGSYVVSASGNIPLIIAGGGGGAAGQCCGSQQNGMPGVTTTSGSAGSYVGCTTGSAGINGNGGGIGSGAESSGAGGGFYTNGGNGTTSTGGYSYLNGGGGGTGSIGTTTTTSSGGFGGGGGAHTLSSWTNGSGGGGGGYSGGASNCGYSQWGNGGGGGSYNVGTSQLNSSGVQSGNGQILITLLAGISIVQTASVTCNGLSNAVLTASASGGTAPYSYMWSPGGSTSPTLSGIGAGTYTCSATDAASVVYTTTFTVTQPSILSSTITSQSNLSCYGAGNGQITIAASGGITPYTYSWSPAGGTSATASGLAAGTYTGYVRDANNCLTSQVTTITQPAPTSILGFATSPTVCLGQTTILIGAGALTYTWTGGATNGVPFAPPASGVYTVSGTNGSGCVGTATVALTVNPLPPLVVSGTTLICNGNSTTLTVSGANSYTWSTSAITNTIAVSPSSTTSYTASGTDGNGCVNSIIKTVTVLNGAPSVTANASTPAVCAGSPITLFGSGASTYTWTGGVTDNVPFSPVSSGIYTVTGFNPCGSGTAIIAILVHTLPSITANASSTAVCQSDAVTLSGGGGVSYSWSGGVTNNIPFTPGATATYTVTGTDVNGCQNTASKTIVVNPLPTITANVTNSVVCFGNITTLFGGGGVSYSWTGGVTNNVAFTPGTTTTYFVTGTDANGCQGSAGKTVTVLNVPALTASASNSSVCFGNPTTLSASGATSYSWTGGVTNNVSFVPGSTNTYTVYGTNSCGTVSTTVTVVVYSLPVVTANASNTMICVSTPVTLSGGGANTYTWTGGITNNVAFTPGSTNTYTVTGTDANGCQNTASKTIVVNPLPAITANVTSSVVCLGNSTTLFGGGGVSYSWTGGVTNNVAFAPVNTTTYTVTGTDANGCQNTASKTVTVINVPALVASASNSSVCFGNPTTLSASGAITYTWTDGVTNNVAFTPTITNTYTIYATNSCGTVSTAITVTVNPLPVVTANASNTITCFNTPISLFGGGANTYTWSGGILNNVPFLPTVNATYVITGTDANGCQNTASKTLTVLSLPAVTASASSSAFCNGNSTTLNGGGASTYSWTGGVTNNTPFTPSVTTTYTVTGTGTNGCQNTAVKTITVHQLPVVYANVTNSVICSSNSTSFYGSGAHTYTWTGGITNNSILFPTANSTYTVSGTNTLTGCTSTNLAYASVTVNALPTVTIIASSPSVCPGQTVMLTAGGANTYTWTGGVISGVAFVPTVTTSYFLTGKNTTTGCSNITMQTIVVNPLPVVSASVSSPVICGGDSVIFTGLGAHTYTWSGGVTNGIPFYPTIGSLFSVIGTNTLTGCTSTNNASQYITVYQAPMLSIAITNTAVCMGGTTAITATGANSYTLLTGATNGVPFTPSATAIYTITGMNSASGCKTTLTRTIVVNPRPVVTVNSPTLSACSGNTIVLAASGADTYTWTGGIVNGVPFTPFANASYSVTGTNTLTGCTSTNSVSQSITLSASPTVSSTVSASTVCKGNSVIFTGMGADTYTWTNGPIDGVPFIPLQSDNYTVTGTSTLTGCTSTNSSVQNVIVSPVPQISLASSHSLICAGESSTLTVGSTASYTWSTGETTSTLLITPTVTSSYTVFVKGSNTCTNSAVITQSVSDCTDLSQHAQSLNSALLIYPNPSNGNFTIKGTGSLALTVLNELGQVVRTVLLEAENEYTMNIENLPAGIYFATGRHNNQFIKQKIVLTR